VNSRPWDLYVVPSARRCSAARALVDAVGAAAAGAIRLSVQTEPDNAAAIALYRASGFLPVEDLYFLSLDLP
jgi:ribosomal protein S18 acetylase RimI-like enzyme